MAPDTPQTTHKIEMTIILYDASFLKFSNVQDIQSSAIVI